MTVEVGVRELRENLAEWLDRAAAGEDILVTERGKPKVRLTQAESVLGPPGARRACHRTLRAARRAAAPGTAARRDLSERHHHLRKRRREPLLIAYVDTSALVKLTVDEVGSGEMRELWDEGLPTAASAIGYSELCCALAGVVRSGRSPVAAAEQVLELANGIWRRIATIGVEGVLARHAGGTWGEAWLCVLLTQSISRPL